MFLVVVDGNFRDTSFNFVKPVFGDTLQLECLRRIAKSQEEIIQYGGILVNDSGIRKRFNCLCGNFCNTYSYDCRCERCRTLFKIRKRGEASEEYFIAKTYKNPRI